jgi:putative ABC transport system permease protein
MRLSNISFGNLRRRKGRTLLLAAGLTIGVAMAVAMVGITMRMKADVERKLDEYGANIIVTPRSESLALSYGGVGVTDTSFDVEELGESDIEAIRHIELAQNVSAVAPKVVGSVPVGERTAMVVGVDFPAEFRLKKWWRIEGMAETMPGFTEPPVKDARDVVVGHAAAATLGLSTGGTLTLGGTDYRVAGVLEENASQDDYAVFVDRGEAQRLLGKEGRVSLIEVSALCSDCPIEDIVAQISAAVPHAKVSAVRQAMTLRMQTVEQLVRFSIAVSAVVLLIGALIVFVSMLSSVNERTKEIGVLRAIGFRRTHIMKIVLLEAFVVSLASGLAGWFLGSVSVAFLAPELTQAGGLSFDPLMLAAAAFSALFVGMASSIYPAVKASNLDPIEALRYI